MSSKVKWQHHLALFFFIFSAVSATFFSVDFHQSVNAQWSLFSGLCFYLIILLCIDTQKSLFIAQIILPLLLLAMLFYVAPDVFSVRHIAPLNDVKQLESVFLVVPNDVVMLSVAAPLMLGAAWNGGWWAKLLVVCYVFLAIIISVNMQSRQAALLLLLGVVMVVGMMQPRWTVYAFLAGLLVCIVIDWFSGWVLAHKIFMFPRTYVWHTAWTMFVDRPLTGQGPGVFKDLYFAYLQKAGYLLSELPDRRPMNWAHSLYFEQLAERGIPGFFSLLVLLAVSLGLAGKSWRESRQKAMRAMSAGLVAALVVFAAAGIAETTFSRLWVSVLLLVLVALAVAISRITDQEMAQARSM